LSTISDELHAVAAHRSIEPKRLRASLRGELDWIVMKCLEKAREQRYESAAALANDLAMHLSDQPISAGKPSRVHILRKFVRRNKGPVLATAIIALVLIGGVIGTTIGMTGEARQRAVAEIQRAEARDNLINFFWTKARNAEAEKIIRAELAAIGAPDTSRKAKIYSNLGSVLCDERRSPDELRLGEAEESFRQTVRIYRTSEPPDSPLLCESLMDLGMFLASFKRFPEAEVPFREGVAMARRTMPADSELRAEYLMHFADALANQGKDLPEAEALLRETMDVYRKQQPPMAWRIASAHCVLGNLLMGLHRFPEAEAEFIAAEPMSRYSMKIYRDLLTRIVEFYTIWDKAEPGRGYDLKAQEWKATHDRLSMVYPTSTDPSK
jgi:tetratricopeptide (TPR) repeat protein